MNTTRIGFFCAVFAGCNAPVEPGPAPGGLPQHSLVATTAASRVIAIGTNYISGTAWSVGMDGAARSLPLGATGDTVVRPLGDVIAVLNRDPNQVVNLTLLEERDGATALVSQIDLRLPGDIANVNPHDVIALDAATLLVARYAAPSLAVVDVARGEVVRTVDLAPYRGIAPLPQPDALYRVGDRVYVTLERLDDSDHPTQHGLLVQLDARTLAVTATLELPFANPTGAMVRVRDGVVRVAAIGSYYVVGDGGVIELDLRNETPVATVVMNDDDLAEDLRGNVDGLAVIDDDVMVLKVPGEEGADRNFDVMRVLRYDRRTRESRVLLQRDLWSGAAPVVVGQTVFAADPGVGGEHTGAGVRRFSLAGDALGTGAAGLGVEMFPYDLQAAP